MYLTLFDFIQKQFYSSSIKLWVVSIFFIYIEYFGMMYLHFTRLSNKRKIKHKALIKMNNIEFTENTKLNHLCAFIPCFYKIERVKKSIP